MHDYVNRVLQVKGEYEIPKVFETERLIFKHPPRDYYESSEFYDFINSGEDAEKMIKLNDFRANAGQEYTRSIWDLMNSRWHREDVEFLCWFIELRDKKEQERFEHPIIGLTNLRILRRLNKAQMGIILHPNFWGNEFSAERAKALVDICFNSEIEIDLVEVSPQVENSKSISSVEKYLDELNGHRVGTIENYQKIEEQGVVDSVLYQITKEEYRNRQA